MVNKLETYSFSLNRAENFFEHRAIPVKFDEISAQERRLNFSQPV
jgi:hypothetical protein